MSSRFLMEGRNPRKHGPDGPGSEQPGWMRAAGRVMLGGGGCSGTERDEPLE